MDRTAKAFLIVALISIVLGVTLFATRNTNRFEGVERHSFNFTE